MKILYDYTSSPSESSSGDVDDVDVNFVVPSSTTVVAAAVVSNTTTTTTTTNNDLISVVTVDNVGEVNGAGESADSIVADGMATMVATPFETMRLIKIGLLAIMFILIFCGNVFVLIALNNRKLRKNRMYFFLVHLSIADLVTGFFNVLPQLAWEITRRFYGGNFLCKMVKFLQILGPYLSSYILVVTSIDRYQAICHPLSNHQNTRRSRWMVAIAWTLSLLYCTPQCFIFSYQKVSEDYYDCWATFPEPWMLKLYVTWYAISVFMVPFLILTWTHYFICREIWLNWHSKRQSLLVKPDLINKKTNNHHHHCNNNSSSITADSNASGIVANNKTIDEMIGKSNTKSYSLSTSFGASVNNLIHRLSNSGLENKDDQQQFRSSMANFNYNSAPHHHHHHHHHHLQNQSKSVCRRLLWFNRKSSSLSSSTTSSSDSPTSTMPPVDINSGHLVQKCPFHQHKFRHHPSRHGLHRIDDNDDDDDDSHQKESIKKSIDEPIKALKHAKSESELLFRKQEKQLKHKRFLNGSIDSVVSIDEVFNRPDDQTSSPSIIKNGSSNLQPTTTATIRMAKSDRIVYSQDCSKYLDKRIKQWMIVKRHRPPLLPHSFQDRSNSDGVVRVPYGKPSKTAASSSLSCICCPKCCAYCHHYRSRSIESQTKELPYQQQGSVYANKSQQQQQQQLPTKPQRPISISTTNNKNDCDFPSSKTSILVVPSDDGFSGTNRGGRSALKSNPNTVPSTPINKCATTTTTATTIGVSSGDTNNVVNVFVPRTYHINAGNKRMSNPRIHSMHGLTRAKIKTVKITLVVITCYVLCSTPFIFVQLWAQFWPNAQESPIYTGPVIAILMLLASLNSCVNPWIYIYFNPNLITLFCQFFKRKSTSEDPASKSCSLQNNVANNYNQLGVSHAKLRKKSTTESPEFSLMSMNESYQTPPIQVDLFDLNKKRTQSSNRTIGSTMANYHLNPATMTNATTTIMASRHTITSDSCSMNSFVQDLTDNSVGKTVDDPNQKPYHHRSSTDDSVDGESFSYNSSNKTKQVSKASSTTNSKKKRRHSISIHLDRMWAKLSLTKQYAQQQRQQHHQHQQQQLPQPTIKSSRIRLYKAATMDVECVVDNDQYII